MRLRLAVVLICLPVALASAVAIAAGRETFCTLVAGPSGLHVIATPRSSPGATGAIRRMTVCARQRCVTRRVPSLGELRGIHVAAGYQRLPVRVVLDYRDGRRKLLRARVTMRPREINGPRCGTDWLAYVRVVGDRLVVDEI